LARASAVLLELTDGTQGGQIPRPSDVLSTYAAASAFVPGLQWSGLDGLTAGRSRTSETAYNWADERRESVMNNIAGFDAGMQYLSTTNASSSVVDVSFRLSGDLDVWQKSLPT